MATNGEVIKAFLADRDVACPGCGYNLRGCAAEMCSECGRRIEIGLRSDALTGVVRWWAIGSLAVNVLVAGAGLVQLAITIYRFSSPYWEIWLDLTIGILFLIYVVGLCGSLFVLKKLRGRAGGREIRLRGYPVIIVMFWLSMWLLLGPLLVSAFQLIVSAFQWLQFLVR